MSEGKSLGISNKMFIAGLIIAILASSILSTVIATQWAIGPQGPKGDKETQDHKEKLGFRDFKEHRDHKENKDQKVLKDHRVNQALDLTL